MFLCKNQPKKKFLHQKVLVQKEIQKKIFYTKCSSAKKIFCSWKPQLSLKLLLTKTTKAKICLCDSCAQNPQNFNVILVYNIFGWNKSYQNLIKGKIIPWDPLKSVVRYAWEKFYQNLLQALFAQNLCWRWHFQNVVYFKISQFLHSGENLLLHGITHKLE